MKDIYSTHIENYYKYFCTFAVITKYKTYTVYGRIERLDQA